MYSMLTDLTRKKKHHTCKIISQSLYIGGAKSGETDCLLSVFFYEGGGGEAGGSERHGNLL